MFLAFGLVWAGYLLGWYGYATLQQSTGPNPNGIGIADLILPSRVSKVDQKIQNGWTVYPGQQAPGAITPGPNYKGPLCPDGKPPIYIAPSGQPVCGTVGL